MAQIRALEMVDLFLCKVATKWLLLLAGCGNPDPPKMSIVQFGVSCGFRPRAGEGAQNHLSRARKAPYTLQNGFRFKEKRRFFFVKSSIITNLRKGRFFSVQHRYEILLWLLWFSILLWPQSPYIWQFYFVKSIEFVFFALQKLHAAISVRYCGDTIRWLDFSSRIAQ